MNRRINYLFVLASLIGLGLASRKINCISAEIGDALWAMAVYAFLRVLCPNTRHVYIALASLFLSFAVEFSQLIHYKWLDALRSTWIGHMLLGQGFLWLDLVAYSVGIAIIFCLCCVLPRKA